MTTTHSITLSTLNRFVPFATLDQELVKMLIANITYYHAPKGFCLFTLDQRNKEQFYLVKGKVQLLSKSNEHAYIEAGLPNSNHPLSRACPRQHRAMAATDIEYFTINNAVLDELNRNVKKPADYLSLLARTNVLDESGNALLHLFQHELIRGSFSLPSIPTIAIKIRQIIDQADCSATDVATLVCNDPAMAAKLLQAANSPIYRGVAQCTDLISAITRLGLTTTKQLVTSFAILGLFKTDSTALKYHMENLRQQSVTVALYCQLFARHIKGFNADEALLLGLLHTLGTLVVLSYADQFSELDNNELLLAVLIHRLSGPVGALIMEDWMFSNNAVIVASESADWLRNKDPALDYCDLIIIAKIASLLGDNAAETLTRDSPFPAVKKLQQQHLSPQEITAIVAQAQEQLSEMRKLFFS